MRPEPDRPVEAAAPRKQTRARIAGTTSEQREAPFSRDPSLLAEERDAAASRPDQLPLFLPGASGSFSPLLGGMPALQSDSSLELARAWYRISLEAAKRPANTVESYSYDLVKLEDRIGSKPIDQITRSDIASFLGLANNRATRKRRITSLRRFFRYLIDDTKVLAADPVEGFFPHNIQLRSPIPLFPNEQAAMLTAAADDEPWSLAAIWLMMRLGLSRAELLALRREQIDLSEADNPIVYVIYDDVARRGKERKLAGGAEFGDIYSEFLIRKEPVDLLFTIGFQAVNGMVGRVAEAAGIDKDVSPQTLRHTFAVERAKAGAGETELLEALGLADDARNRASVRRYTKLAEPPL